MHAGWVVAFIPAVVALGAWLFLSGRLRAIGWVGIAAASVGVLVPTCTRTSTVRRGRYQRSAHVHRHLHMGGVYHFTAF